MIALLTGFAPFILALGTFWLERIQASNETKKNFFKFVEGLGKDGVLSVSLTLSYEEQRRKLEQLETAQPK